MDKLKDKYKGLSAYSFTTYNNELVISFDGFENQQDILEFARSIDSGAIFLTTFGYELSRNGFVMAARNRCHCSCMPSQDAPSACILMSSPRRSMNITSIAPRRVTSLWKMCWKTRHGISMGLCRLPTACLSAIHCC